MFLIKKGRPDWENGKEKGFVFFWKREAHLFLNFRILFQFKMQILIITWIDGFFKESKPIH